MGTDLRDAARQALEALGKWSSGRDMDAVELNDLIATPPRCPTGSPHWGHLWGRKV